MAIFLDTKCKWCNHYKYLNSDYGRLGADYYTCSKNQFSSTREDKWYLKSQECKLCETSFLLTKKELEQVINFEKQVIE
jgi:hypothetical protein